MDITPLIPAERQVIDAYGGGGFRVSGAAYEGSILVLPERTAAWSVSAVAEITLDSLAPVIAAEPAVEILLLGCGARMAVPDQRLRAELREAGIVLDPMDTGAACRTYNVLLAESRRVAAALLPVD